MNNYFCTGDNLPPGFREAPEKLPEAPDFDELADNLEILNRKIHNPPTK